MKIRAAGILCICPSTQRILIAKRNIICPEPLTLCSIGGKAENDELPFQTAIREFNEECGAYNCNFDTFIKGPIYQDEKLQFHNFIATVKKEFIPIYNYESEWIKWLSVTELFKMKKDFHFGLTYLFENI